ncbi:MAG TPA: AMMECR1 domain-containing protein [Capsulimonadaceae bacterium]|jgi:AMMECR1 domain-containing protein
MKRVLLILLAIIAVILPPEVKAGPADDWRLAPPSTKEFALTLARQAFDTYARERRVIDTPSNLPPLLRERAPVFVSAMINHAPRCCMGSIYPIQGTTADEIITNAVAAAGRDRRFSPVKPTELARLTLIVSILNPPHVMDIKDIDHINPVTTGLAARSGDRLGIVLSGETNSARNMLVWARIRAGASSSPVQYFELHDYRIVETGPHKESPVATRAKPLDILPP